MRSFYTDFKSIVPDLYMICTGSGPASYVASQASLPAIQWLAGSARCTLVAAALATREVLIASQQQLNRTCLLPQPPLLAEHRLRPRRRAGWRLDVVAVASAVAAPARPAAGGTASDILTLVKHSSGTKDSPYGCS